MKNAMRLILAGMLCMMLAAQEPEKEEGEAIILSSATRTRMAKSLVLKQELVDSRLPSRRITPLTST